MTVLRLLLIVTVVIVAYFVVIRPREIRRWGRTARKIAFIYIATILISAVLQAVGLYPGL